MKKLFKIFLVCFLAVFFSLDSSAITTLQIRQGGTGATTAANARTNLGVPDYTGFARALVYRTASQSIANLTETAITFPTGSATEAFDDSGMHDMSTNTSRLTVPSGQGGIYEVGATWSFAQGGGTGTRNSALVLNGSTYISDCNINNNDANGGVTQTMSTIVSLSAGDYIELKLTHNNGSALNATSGLNSLNLWAKREY